MRKLFVVVLVLLALGAVALLVRFRMDYTAMKTQADAARDHYSRTIDTIAEITDSLNAITLGDTLVRMLPKNLRDELRMAEPDGHQALDRIADLRGSLLRNKERIHQLENDLRKSGIRASGLEKMIGRLKQTLAEKETQVGQLSGLVDSLRADLAGLTTAYEQSQAALASRDQTIEERRRELASVFYIIGKKRDLKTAGAIVTRGGLFGLGGTLVPSGHLDEANAQVLDTDQNLVLPTQSPRARVLSEQPPSSYELKLVNGQVELHITNVRLFRKVRQLVILTT
jgi:multidrug resistance efflux pump